MPPRADSCGGGGPEARWQAVLQTTSSVQPETLIPSHMDKRMKERLLSIYF